MRLATVAPAHTPMICAAVYTSASPVVHRPRIRSARVTTGLKCAPDTGPSARISATRPAPKVLADVGLIAGEKRERWVWWKIVAERVAAARGALEPSAGRRGRNCVAGAPRSQRGEHQPEPGGQRREHEARDDVAQRGREFALFGEPHGLVGERRERRVRTAESGAEHGLGSRRERVVEHEAREEAEQQRAGDVDHERAEGQLAANAALHVAVEEVAGGRADRARDRDAEDQHRDPIARAVVIPV